MNVIRRTPRVAIEAAPPRAPIVQVPKVALSPAEEREVLVRRRTVGIRNEVRGIFAKLGVVDLEAR